MSYIFDVGEDTVWSPSLRVGRLYVTLASCIVGEVGRGTGLDAVADDMYQIDLPVFGAFVRAVYDDFFSTDHQIHRDLLRGWLSVSLVLLERAGTPIEARTEEQKSFLLEVQGYAQSMPE